MCFCLFISLPYTVGDAIPTDKSAESPVDYESTVYTDGHEYEDVEVADDRNDFYPHRRKYYNNLNPPYYYSPLPAPPPVVPAPPPQEGYGPGPVAVPVYSYKYQV